MPVYRVQQKTIKRLSDVTDRYIKRGSATIEHGLWQPHKTLPVLKATHGLSWVECIFQIFFSVQGPAFFILPSGLHKVGYLPGLLGLFAAGLFYLHTMQLYLWCEAELRRRRKLADDAHPSLYSLTELVFDGRCAGLRRALVVYLKYEIVVSWSVGLSFNEIFVCQNLRLVLEYFGHAVDDRLLLAALFPLTTLVSFVPDLKVMSLIAYSTTAVLVANMLAVVYVMVADPTLLAPIAAANDPAQLVAFLPTVLFTINCTPLIFPLKREMRKPSQFGAWWGSLNASVVAFIVLNAAFSMLAYVKYGDATCENLIENLPHGLPTTVCNLMLSVAVVACGSISFFVIFETVWRNELLPALAGSKHLRLYEYATRTAINAVITAMAMAIPSLSLLVLLISSFSYPYDSIFLPALLQCVLLWSEEENRGLRWSLVLAKNALLLVAGLAFSAVMLVTFAYGISDAYK